MLQASHDAPQNQTPCVETFHNRENRRTAVAKLGTGRHGPGRQAVAPGRTGASRGRTGVPRENRAQECQESHRAGMSRTGKHGKNRSSGVVFLGATPPDRKGLRALTSGRVMEATGPPSSAGLPGLLSPSDQLNSWQSRAPPTLSLAGPTELPGIPNPAGLTGPLGVLSRPESPRQPRAARKARDPGLSGLARRGHNQK